MGSTFDSFEASPLGGFIESALAARGLADEGAVTDYFMGFSGGGSGTLRKWVAGSPGSWEEEQPTTAILIDIAKHLGFTWGAGFGGTAVRDKGRTLGTLTESFANIYAARVFAGELYLGGVDAGGAGLVQKWSPDADQFVTVATTIGTAVHALASYGGALTIGIADSGSEHRVKQLGGSPEAWSDLGSGLTDGIVYGLAVLGSELVASGGKITRTDDTFCVYDGAAWSEIDASTVVGAPSQQQWEAKPGGRTAVVLGTYAGKVYMPGSQWVDDGGPTEKIGFVTYDGAQLSLAIECEGGATGDFPNSADVLPDGSGIIIAGDIGTANGTTINGVATFDGSTVTRLGTVDWRSRNTCARALSYVPDPPVVETLSDDAGLTGVPYSRDVDLTDADKDATWSLDTAPSGMTIGSTTGTISWASPTAGSHTVTVRATNNYGADTESYTLTVTGPPPPPPPP